MIPPGANFLSLSLSLSLSVHLSRCETTGVKDIYLSPLCSFCYILCLAHMLLSSYPHYVQSNVMSKGDDILFRGLSLQRERQNSSLGRIKISLKILFPCWEHTTP